jgi:hypothetical protein
MTIWDILAALVAIGLVLGGVAYFRWRRDHMTPPPFADDSGDPRPPPPERKG